MHPKNLTLLAAKQALRTLQTVPSFRSLTPEEQKSFQKRLSRGFEQALSAQSDIDLPSALDSFYEDGLAADYLNELAFRVFVGDLIEVLFDRDTQGTLTRMESYRGLIKAALIPFSKFSAQISEQNAVKYLNAPFDQEAGATVSKKQKGSRDHSPTAIRTAKRILAEEQRRLLRQAALSGIARLMVDGAPQKNGLFSTLDLDNDPYNLQLRKKLIRAWFPTLPGPGRLRSAAVASTRPRRVGDLSGGQWVSRFPGSKELIDLEPVFRSRVARFLSALSSAGASVRISSTFRPPERAYLMHWSWKIFKGLETGENIPPKAGVEIIWWHGNVDDSRRAATDMVLGYGIDRLRIPPALNSRHTERKAIDMSIGWIGRLVIRTAQGQNVTISGEPRDGTNSRLIEVGRTYEVIHFLDVAKDPPHWSTDGR